VGTRTLHVEDARSGRELVVQLWYPAGEVAGLRLARYSRAKEAKPQFVYWAGIRTNSFQDAPVAAGAHPLLLFGPMWGGRRTQDTFLAEELASHGYVVAAIDHPGNAARVERSDGRVVESTMARALSNIAGTTAPAIEELWAKELTVWVRDDELVLDRLLTAEWLEGHIDPARIGAFGHSFGGAASMALLGKDPRVRCALDMDGWTFNGLATRTAQPVMFIYAGPADARLTIQAATEPGPEGELDRYDQAVVSGSLRQFGGVRATLAGTQHLDFTDQTLLSPLQRLTYTGPMQGARVREIVRAMVLGFFDRELRGMDGGMSSYPEVKVKRFGNGE
jgi:dienelactone hydrolase